MNTQSVEEFFSGTPTVRSAHVYQTSLENSIPLAIIRNSKSDRGAPLIVVFHGAINQETREVTGPVFVGSFLFDAIQDRATIISIADPSLSLSKKLRTAWYAGNHKHDTAAELRRVVQAAVDYFRPSRLIFTGGSTGGHPALAVSHAFPGSIAVVVHPILTIENYAEHHIQEYLDHCWPELPDKSALSGVVVSDVTTLYEKGQNNLAILLNNATDGHLKLQSSPFHARIRYSVKTLVLSELFPGYSGHSYPIENWTTWVVAAATSSSRDLESIAKAATTSLRTNFRPIPDTSWDAFDTDMADQLSIYHRELCDE